MHIEVTIQIVNQKMKIRLFSFLERSKGLISVSLRDKPDFQVAGYLDKEKARYIFIFAIIYLNMEDGYKGFVRSALDIGTIYKYNHC